MALTKISSSVLGSAVSTVDQVSGSGAASASGIGGASTSSLEMHIGPVGTAQVQVNLIMTLTGPNGFKKKVGFTGNSKHNLINEVGISTQDWTALSQDGVMTGSSVSGLFGNPTVNSGSLPLGDAGDYELHLDCNGAPADLLIFIPRAAESETTAFKFSGFSHGEAIYKFNKA